jgi:ubiquinone/menaquinone biosynthesis C-methylase UbiE
MGIFEEDWQKRFERFARDYCADHLISGWSESGLWRRLTLFEELLRDQRLSDPAHVLDLGCGAATYVRFLAGLGHRVVGLDYSLPSLSRAQAADSKKVGDYVGGEVYHLPFCDGCFDLVVSIGVFQTLGSPEEALCEMVRVLRPKGLLIVEFLNAFELVAMIRYACEKLRGRLPRLHTYSPFKMNHWLEQRAIRFIRRAGVYLPPRRLPWLERLFTLKGFVPLLEKTPGISLLGPHAFLMVGEKRGG